MTTAAAQLPHAADVRRAREALEGATDRGAVLVARGDLEWSLIDQARALAADPTAYRLAAELADEGDEIAASACELADELGPGPPPRPPDSPNMTPSPFEPGLVPGHLREMLEGARRDKESFAVAWSQALFALGVEHGLWLWVLSSTREAWRSAYLGEDPPRGQRVIGWPDCE